MTLLGRLRVIESKHLYFLLIAFLLPIHFIPTFRKGVTWFHLVNAVVLGGYLIKFILQGRRPQWHFVLPMWIYLMGSLMGMFNSQVIAINIFTLAQDAYLYIWFVALCMVITTQDDIDYVAAAWMVAGLVVIVVGTLVIRRPGELLREELTFLNPNRSATYVMMMLGMMFAPVFARRPWLRASMVILGVWAVWRAGSLGAFTSVAVMAITATSALHYLRTGGFWVVRQGVLLVMIGVLAYASVMLGDLETALVEGVPESFGRAERSVETRGLVWDSGLDSFRKHPFGIGPASFFQQVPVGLGSTGSLELHSDYIASLVERGVVGLAGFVLLQLMLLREVLQMLRSARRSGRDVQVWVAALTGLLAGYITYQITHEALHHDTLWLLFALIVAQRQILARAPSRVQAQSVSSGQWPLPAGRRVLPSVRKA